MPTKLTKAEMEANLRDMVTKTFTILEHLHLVHNGDPIEKILDTKLPIGNDLTLASLLVSLYEILDPIMSIAIKILEKQFPAVATVMSWVEDIVKAIE